MSLARRTAVAPNESRNPVMMTRHMFAVLVVIGAVGLLPAAASAQAPAGPDSISASCTTQKICLYEDDDFLGGYLFYSASDPSYTNNYFQGTGHNVNDRVSSIANYNCAPTGFYEHVNQGGLGRTLGNYSIWADLDVYGANDVFSSHLRQFAC